jgi:hypothetical protein
MSDHDNDTPKDLGEGRLSRWSRLKTQARAGQDVSELAEAPADGAVPATIEDESEENDFVLEDLPDIETLNKDSDFTPFLNVNVPDQLRRLALKKLWASDPAFASLDGLNDYDEDYSALGMIAEKVSSVFKLGEGMRGAEPEPGQIQSDPENPQQPPEEVAEASAGDDDGESSEEPDAGSDDGETDDLEAPEVDSAAAPQVPDDPDKTTA